MCIICNMDDYKADVAGDFLNAFDRSREEMKKACDAMLAVSRAAVTPELKKHYRMFHKQMVRQMREWNRLEEKRENHPESAVG